MYSWYCILFVIFKVLKKTPTSITIIEISNQNCRLKSTRIPTTFVRFYWRTKVAGFLVPFSHTFALCGSSTPLFSLNSFTPHPHLRSIHSSFHTGTNPVTRAVGLSMIMAQKMGTQSQVPNSEVVYGETVPSCRGGRSCFPSFSWWGSLASYLIPLVLVLSFMK